MSLESVTYEDYSLCCPDFINGIEFLKRGMISQARHCFEVAYEQTSYSHMYYNKYASFCGYTRSLGGDRGGVAICREVARNELHDGDVFFNLAKSEWHFKDRKRTVDALLLGTEVDNMHPGMRELSSRLRMREKAAIGFLPRNNLLNNKLGKLLRK